MKNMKSRLKRFGIASLAGLLVLGSIKQESLAEESQEKDHRIGFGYSINDSTQTLQTTFGMAPKGSYPGAGIPVKGQFLEDFRLYDKIKITHDKTFHDVLLGFKSPSLKTGNLENKAMAFGGLGDVQGLGIETTHDFVGKVQIGLNGEIRRDIDASRLGASFTYSLTESLKLSAAYDRISIGSEKSEQYFGNLGWDLNKRDTLGFAVFNRKNFDNSESIGAGTFWTHYADDAKWGTFGHFHVESNSDRDERSFGGEIFIAQHPTTSKYGGMWTTGRSVGSDDFYNSSVVPLSVSLTEPIRLYDRSKNGLSFSLRGEAVSNNGKEQANFGCGIGYYFKLQQPKALVGFSLESLTSFSEDSVRTKLEPNFIYRSKYRDHLWGISGGLVVPLEGEGLTVRAGLLWTF